MWEIEFNGTRKSLADWGISNVTRRLVNQGRDEVKFVADGAEFDGVELFAYGSDLTFYHDSVRWFFGRVIQTPKSATGRAESQQYVVAGPWWWLEELVFQREWFAGYNSHVILNLDSDGTLGTIKEQIEAVLNFAIAAGVPLLVGSVTPNVTPPADEVRDLSCAAVITKELRWALSDAITWFDYTTSPPTFHCKLASELEVKTFALGSVTELRIEPRNDLIRPAVVIKYEIRSTIDDQEIIALSIDKYPLSATGLEFGALVLTIDQLGIRGGSLMASLTTSAIDGFSGSEAARLAWWKTKKPELAHENVSMTAVTVATRSNAAAVGLDNELVDGQIAPWMPFDAQHDTIQALATYTVYDRPPGEAGAVVLQDKVQVPINVGIIATDATTGDYSDFEITEGGDPIPIGLAEFLYNRVKDLKWQGAFVLEEDELTGAAGMGNLITVTDTPVESALVQSVTENVDLGQTVLDFGPPSHLDVPGLLALLRVGRERIRVTPVKTYQDGTLGAANFELGKQTAKVNSTEGEGQNKILRMKDGDLEIELNATSRRIRISDATDRKIYLDLTDIFSADEGSLPVDAQLIKVREAEVCVYENGAARTKRALVVMGAPYDPPQ